MTPERLLTAAATSTACRDRTSHFGNSEVRWLDNLLYLYTKPFDVVVDTFASGETVS
ncbi:MAG: hypothetical protein ACR2KT_00050 [Methylocella sp.]